jgi:hypothetical protein
MNLGFTIYYCAKKTALDRTSCNPIPMPLTSPLDTGVYHSHSIIRLETRIMLEPI